MYIKEDFNKKFNSKLLVIKHDLEQNACAKNDITSLEIRLESAKMYYFGYFIINKKCIVKSVKLKGGKESYLQNVHLQLNVCKYFSFDSCFIFSLLLHWWNSPI